MEDVTKKTKPKPETHAEPKPVEVNEDVKETKTEESKEAETVLLATRDTQLPDGTFVGEGKEIVVAVSYAEKVLKEANTPFKLISK